MHAIYVVFRAGIPVGLFVACYALTVGDKL